jgi:hypothetical protein
VIGLGFNAEPGGGNVIHTHDMRLPPAEPAAAVGPQRDFIIGHVIVQRPCFFFGHSCHSRLLKAERFDKAVAGLHRMKNIDMVIIYRVVHNFKHTDRAIKFTFKYRKEPPGFEEFLTARSQKSNKFLYGQFFSLPFSTFSTWRFIFFKIL